MTVLLALGLLASSSVRAEIPPRLEPEYAEAVLAYNARDFKKAIASLDELAKVSPDTTEFIELKALALKGAGRQKEAVELYEKLIVLKERDKADPEELAPYHFELGVLRFREGKLDEAKEHLDRAADEDFNEGASHFFLGLIDFKAGRWSGSEGHFAEVASSNADDLKPATHYYLAQLSMKTHYSTGATYNLIHAKDWADSLIESESTGKDARAIAEQIQKAADKALAPLDRTRRFGNVALLLASDSNVLAMPEIDGGATDVSALKALAQVSVGMLTSPLRTFQFAPALRASVPLHMTNRAATKNGEYTAYQLSVPITYNPLAPLSFTLKPEVGFTFQNQAAEDTFVDYKPFNLRLGVTPSVRWEIAPKKILGLELAVLGNRYYLNMSEENSRDGMYLRPRLSYRNDVGRRFWNPTFALKYQQDETNGSNFRGGGAGAEISNLMYLGEKTILGQTVTASFAKYDEARDPEDAFRDGGRYDSYLSFQLTATHRLTDRLTLLGEIKRESNKSDIDSFEYGRTVFSAGASYSL